MAPEAELNTWPHCSCVRCKTYELAVEDYIRRFAVIEVEHSVSCMCLSRAIHQPATTYKSSLVSLTDGRKAAMEGDRGKIDIKVISMLAKSSLALLAPRVRFGGSSLL